MEKLSPIIWLIIWIVIWALGRLGKKRLPPLEEKGEEKEILPSFFEKEPYPEEKVLPVSPGPKEVSPGEKLEGVPPKPERIEKPRFRQEEKPSFRPSFLPFFRGERNIFRQGIILSEILGPPRARRFSLQRFNG
jgi:hypothetical protein